MEYRFAYASPTMRVSFAVPAGAIPATATWGVDNVLLTSITTNYKPVAEDKQLHIAADPVAGGQNTIELRGHDNECSTLEYEVTSLPTEGLLYLCTCDSIWTTPITTVPLTVPGPCHRLVYAPQANMPKASLGGLPFDTFEYKVKDANGVRSDAGSVDIYVSADSASANTPVAGEAGFALAFDGVDDVVSVSMDPKVQAVGPDFSLEARFRVLDNNDIAKIENLDHLVNLTWLDFSFNKITKIEGLNTLVKLTDLSLFNNEIEAVENLDGLNELHVISLGNNAIKELEYTMYLRRFNKLRMVNLAGNPICKDPEYRSYVLSHIKNLRYLDYRLVEESAILSAKEQYQDEMLEIEEKEAAEETREKQEAERAAHNALMEEANLEGVESLFDDMLRDDPEHAKLSIVPELQTGLAEFREKFDEHLEEFRTTILDQHKKKQEEHDEWLSTVNKATGAKDAAARKVVTDFERTKKAEFRSIKDDPGQVEFRLDPLRTHNEDLQDVLLGLEMQTVEILNELCSEFDRNYSEIVDQNVGHINTFFGLVRDLENVYFENLQEQAGKLLEQFAAGELEEAGDNVRAILQDKDTLVNAMQASHDAHTAKIDGLEDKRVNEEKRRGNELIAEKRDWEAKRNRERISEIWSLVERNGDEINEVQEVQ